MAELREGITYNNIPLGIVVRGTIGGTYDYKYIRKVGRVGTACGRRTTGEYIYRNRRGTNYNSWNARKRIQEKYNYYKPTSINNPQAAVYRIKFKNAVIKWQTILTDTQKQAYNKQANKGLKMSGYNLFIRQEMLKP